VRAAHGRTPEIEIVEKHLWLCHAGEEELSDHEDLGMVVADNGSDMYIQGAYDTTFCTALGLRI
jgi:hypothetical protein